MSWFRNGRSHDAVLRVVLLLLVLVAHRAYADGVHAVSWELGGALAAVVAALVVLTLAEAFEHGARLTEDVEGLV